jgi:hypothetical protein
MIMIHIIGPPHEFDGANLASYSWGASLSYSDIARGHFYARNHSVVSASTAELVVWSLFCLLKNKACSYLLDKYKVMESREK